MVHGNAFSNTNWRAPCPLPSTCGKTVAIIPTMSPPKVGAAQRGRACRRTKRSIRVTPVMVAMAITAASTPTPAKSA